MFFCSELKAETRGKNLLTLSGMKLEAFLFVPQNAFFSRTLPNPPKSMMRLPAAKMSKGLLQRFQPDPV
jgi:hypothetical protein